MDASTGKGTTYCTASKSKTYATRHPGDRPGDGAQRHKTIHHKSSTPVESDARLGSRAGHPTAKAMCVTNRACTCYLDPYPTLLKSGGSYPTAHIPRPKLVSPYSEHIWNETFRGF